MTLTACARGKPTSEQAEQAELAVGQAAPDFSTRDQNNKEVRLSGLRGKYVVLYFYPKDETPGCTREANEFRDAWHTLTQHNATVIGVSADSDASHRAFAANHQLPFTLLSDPDGVLAGKYGVSRTFGIASRQSFVIDRAGKLKKIYRSVDVAVHAKEIAATLP